ncbi:MAG: hypothetical protein AUG20_02000 [Gemmatimonas sp. 13_1_20CM_3_60_15]|nr:MAG: hypothetical protein AUG20_02000 [Gemmatimonas sp. 13_1_20CM_3_60_15]
MNELTHPAAPRNLGNNGMLEIGELLILLLEIANEFLGAVLVETARADTTFRFPLRSVLSNQIENPVFQFLWGMEAPAFHGGVTQRTIDLGHAVVS